MSEMVERVAKALCADALSPENGHDWLAWDDLEEDGRASYRLSARAAIAAMREAAENVECGAGAGYTAMIDAALSEPS